MRRRIWSIILSWIQCRSRITIVDFVGPTVSSSLRRVSSERYQEGVLCVSRMRRSIPIERSKNISMGVFFKNNLAQEGMLLTWLECFLYKFNSHWKGFFRALGRISFVLFDWEWSPFIKLLLLEGKVLEDHQGSFNASRFGTNSSLRFVLLGWSLSRQLISDKKLPRSSGANSSKF